MNQVETWFGVLNRGAIRRGAFQSVRELVERIDAFTTSWNAGASPFVWVKTADESLAKAVRKRSANSELGYELDCAPVGWVFRLPTPSGARDDGLDVGGGDISHIRRGHGYRPAESVL